MPSDLSSAPVIWRVLAVFYNDKGNPRLQRSQFNDQERKQNRLQRALVKWKGMRTFLIQLTACFCRWHPQVDRRSNSVIRWLVKARSTLPSLFGRFNIPLRDVPHTRQKNGRQKKPTAAAPESPQKLPVESQRRLVPTSMTWIDLSLSDEEVNNEDSISTDAKQTATTSASLGNVLKELVHIMREGSTPSNQHAKALPPQMTLAKFCSTYCISSDIKITLKDLKFKGPESI